MFDTMFYSKAWDNLETKERMQIINGLLGMCWENKRYRFQIQGERCEIEFDVDKEKPLRITLAAPSMDYLIKNADRFPALSRMIQSSIDGSRPRKPEGSLSFDLD